VELQRTHQQKRRQQHYLPLRLLAPTTTTGGVSRLLALSLGWLAVSISLTLAFSRERETDHRARWLEDLPGLTRDISIAESDDVMATATVDATAPGVGADGVAAAAPSIQVVRLMVANGNTDETSTVVIDTASSSIDGSTPVRINPELALSCVVQYRTETPLQGMYPSLTRLVALALLLLTNCVALVGWLVGV